MTAIETITALLDKEAEEDIYDRGEQIRNAALYYIMDHDENLTTATFTAACALRGISYNTAKVRLNETRRFMKEG